MRRFASQQASPAKPDDKLFGRYDDLARLLLGFFLTTLIGGALTFWYQRLNAETATAAQFHQYEMTEATKTFSDISHLLDERLYRTRRLYWLKEREEKAPDPDINRDREKYAQVREAWNIKLNGNYALTERYVGNKLRMRLEKEIAKYFIAINCELSKSKPDLKKASAEIETLNPMIYEFNNDMLDALQSDRIGVKRDMAQYKAPGTANLPVCNSEN